MSSVTVRSRLDELPEFLLADGAAGCLAAVNAAAEDAREQIRGQIGSGHKYPDLPSVSSSPGEAPVNQLGDLLRRSTPMSRT